jgi:hypothetical protein
MKSLLKIISLVLLLSLTVYAQQPTLKDSLLDCVSGHWVLQGQIAGKEIVHDVDAEWVLNHQFVKVHEVSREKKENGDPEYQADVYVGWDAVTKEYVCFWIDVWGGASPQSIGRAIPSGNEIKFLFRDQNEKVAFHTTFVYNKDSDSWQWLMDNDDNGKLQPFARVKLSRK